MTDEATNPQQAPVDVAAIEARVRAQLNQEFEAEKAKIIGNRDQILEEKKNLENKFKGFDEDAYSQFQKFQKEVENNEMLKLAADGNIEELSHRLVSGQQKAWTEEREGYEERIKAAQSKAEELEQARNELHSKNLDMMKRNYLKDLTGGDDSFKGEYFGDFYSLQTSRMKIDETDGSVYALGDDGKEIVDSDGNFVKYEDFYNKQKIDKGGLFWNLGSGSGQPFSQGGAAGAKLKDMTAEQKTELRKQIGDQEYAKLLRSQNK